MHFSSLFISAFTLHIWLRSKSIGTLVFGKCVAATLQLNTLSFLQKKYLAKPSLLSKCHCQCWQYFDVKVWGGYKRAFSPVDHQMLKYIIDCNKSRFPSRSKVAAIKYSNHSHRAGCCCSEDPTTALQIQSKQLKNAAKISLNSRCSKIFMSTFVNVWRQFATKSGMVQLLCSCLNSRAVCSGSHIVLQQLC